MAQFERFVLYKLCITKANLDDAPFADPNFQNVISNIANNLTSSTVTAAIAMKFSELCQGKRMDRDTPLAVIRDRIYQANKEVFVQQMPQLRQPEIPFDVERIAQQVQQRQPQGR